MVFIHLPVPGTWLLSLSGECSSYLLFFLSRLTAVVKVWSSSSMRCPRPQEPSRPFKPVSSQSLPLNPPCQHAFRVETTEGTNKRRNDIRKRHPSLDFDFLSFRFCDRPACPVPRCGGFTRHTMFTIDTTTASGQPVRFFCLVRTTTATRPAWFSHLYIPSFCARVPVLPLPNPIPSNDDRSTNHSRTSYAFVEFRSTRDAEDAYNDMYVPNP